MEILQKTKNRTAIWSSNPTPGHISGKNYNSNRYMHPNIDSTIHNSQNMEKNYMSINKCINKEDVVHTYNGILLSPNKWSNAIGSNMDATRDHHTKLAREQIPYDVTYMWNLKYGTNGLIYETETELLT